MKIDKSSLQASPMTLETTKQFLKNELSAQQTYQMVLDKLQETIGPAKPEYLLPIYENHKQAVSALQAKICEFDGTLNIDPRGWGPWSVIVDQGDGNQLLKTATLKALTGGERRCAEDYAQALKNHKLPWALRSLIQNKLLPAQISHIRTLNRLLDS